MKHLLTFVLILLATAFSTVSFAADAFDMASAGEYAVAAESAVTDAEADLERLHSCKHVHKFIQIS